MWMFLQCSFSVGELLPLTHQVIYREASVGVARLPPNLDKICPADINRRVYQSATKRSRFLSTQQSLRPRNSLNKKKNHFEQGERENKTMKRKETSVLKDRKNRVGVSNCRSFCYKRAIRIFHSPQCNGIVEHQSLENFELVFFFHLYR